MLLISDRKQQTKQIPFCDIPFQLLPLCAGYRLKLQGERERTCNRRACQKQPRSILDILSDNGSACVRYQIPGHFLRSIIVPNTPSLFLFFIFRQFRRFLFCHLSATF
ncbi:hypothetical protein CEXT_119231 [Caerostris extrusa]|uniref:Uncharacterized protein n=1 Tax=Caerostris extrusa TaxID=172846 RepID=A0AAV4TME6_CAEEX|nr:hypothetical protein CEXT_119231 [Caerostris extrusa]